MIDISPTSISPFTLTERFDPRAARLMMALAPTVPELNDLTTSGFGKYAAMEGGLVRVQYREWSGQYAPRFFDIVKVQHVVVAPEVKDPKMPELFFLLPITDQLPGYWRYRLPTTKLLPASLINSQATDTTNWETKTLLLGRNTCMRFPLPRAAGLHCMVPSRSRAVTSQVRDSRWHHCQCRVHCATHTQR